MKPGLPGGRSSHALRGILLRVTVGCALVCVLTAFGRRASAEFFQYDTLLDISSVVPVPTNIAGNGSDLVVLTTDLGTDITFTAYDSSSLFPDNLDASSPGTDIVLGIIDVDVSNATPLEALSFDFEFHVEITDYSTNSGGAPNGMATFDVSGTLSGTIGAGLKLNLNSIVVNPVPSQVIGTEIYSLVFQTQHFTPPGPIFPGAIGIHVTALPVPEPAAFALLALGTLGLATPALRRRRRKPRLAD